MSYQIYGTEGMEGQGVILVDPQTARWMAGYLRGLLDARYESRGINAALYELISDLERVEPWKP